MYFTLRKIGNQKQINKAAVFLKAKTEQCKNLWLLQNSHLRKDKWEKLDRTRPRHDVRLVIVNIPSFNKKLSFFYQFYSAFDLVVEPLSNIFFWLCHSLVEGHFFNRMEDHMCLYWKKVWHVVTNTWAVTWSTCLLTHSFPFHCWTSTSSEFIFCH